MYSTQVSPSPTGTTGSALSYAESVHITGFEQNYDEVKTPTKLSGTRKRIIALLSKFMSIKIIIVVSFVLLTIIPAAIILGVVLSYLQNVTQLEITRTAGMQSKSVVLYVGDFLLTPFKACQALSNVLPANIVSTPSLKNFVLSTIQTNPNLKKALVIFDNDGTSLGMSTLTTPQGASKYQQEVLLNLTSTISNVNSNGDPVQVISQYNNDLRQWELYLDGMFGQQPVWSPVYSTGNGSDDSSLAITACVPSFSRDLTVAYGMASCDVGISTINEFLGQLNISSGSSVYLVERYEWRMIANSHVYDKVMGNSGIRKQLTNSSNAYIAELGKQLQIAYGNYDKEARSGAYSLLGKDFTVEFVRLRDDYGLDWYILVVLDNNDFTGTIYQFRDVVLIVAGSVAAGSIVFGIILSLMITRPLDVLGHKMDSFRRMDESTKKKSIFSIIPNSFFHEVKVLQKNYRNMKHTVQAFVKYVPKEIVRDLLDRSEPALFKPFVVQTNLAILFSDIADFTTISEKMDPSTLVCLITLYFEQVSKVISEYGGTLDKYIGDACMAFWNAPKPVDNYQLQACRAALAIQNSLDDLNDRFISEGHEPWRTRVGLHSGPCHVGNIGSGYRLSYSALGDSVNLASRIEGLNKKYGTAILISDTCYEATITDYSMSCRFMGAVQVKGKNEATKVYELASSDVKPRNIAQIFSNATELYMTGMFADALKLYKEYLKHRPNDYATLKKIEECTHAPTSLNEKWDGVVRMHDK